MPQQFQTITIELKKFGVGLNFTPTVLDNDMIAMKVSPEVSELDFTQGVAFVAQGFMVPGLSVRRLSTHVEVKDGRTFAQAGLLSDSHHNVINKFPLVGSIPVLGTLFSSREFQKRETTGGPGDPAPGQTHGSGGGAGSMGEDMDLKKICCGF